MRVKDEDDRSEAEANADYDTRVERAFTSYEKKTGEILEAEARTSLRKEYRVYGRDEEALLDLMNVLEGAAQVERVRTSSVEAPATNKRKPTRKNKPSQKCRDRRYHMVAWVTSRLPKSNRPDWKRLVSEWNADHPLDQVNRNLLKVEYNRALREWGIVFHYLLATKDDRPFREYLKRTFTGPLTTLTGTEALDWLRAHGGNFITIKEKGAK